MPRVFPEKSFQPMAPMQPSLLWLRSKVQPVATWSSVAKELYYIS